MSSGLSENGKIWEELSFDNREKLLYLFFNSKMTIDKHRNKSWLDLPSGFKQRVNFLAAELLLEKINIIRRIK